MTRLREQHFTINPTARTESYPHFHFWETMGEAWEPSTTPPFRVPQADTVEAPGGNEAGQQWRDPQPSLSSGLTRQVGRAHHTRTLSRVAGGYSLDVCILRRHREESSPAMLLSARQLGQGGAGWTTAALAPGPRPSIHRGGRLQEGGHLGICTQDPHTRSKGKFFNSFTPSFSL